MVLFADRTCGEKSLSVWAVRTVCKCAVAEICLNPAISISFSLTVLLGGGFSVGGVSFFVLAFLSSVVPTSVLTPDFSSHCDDFLKMPAGRHGHSDLGWCKVFFLLPGHSLQVPWIGCNLMWVPLSVTMLGQLSGS
jgi:hypothetical protein